jgi:hypothetical protein
LVGNGQIQHNHHFDDDPLAFSGSSGATMIPTLISGSANLAIRKHGAEAELEAAKRADVMLYLAQIEDLGVAFSSR